MATIRMAKDKYNVLDNKCIGRSCLGLGHFQTRGAILSGSRNTGDFSPCCMPRAYHGCPTPLPGFNKELAMARRKEGMKT